MPYSVLYNISLFIFTLKLSTLRANEMW